MERGREAMLSALPEEPRGLAGAGVGGPAGVRRFFMDSGCLLPRRRVKRMSEKNEGACRKAGKCGKGTCGCGRRLRRILAWVVGIFLVFLVGLQIFLSHMTPAVKKVMEIYGPQVTGAPLAVEQVSFSLLRMRFEMKGLQLGNPPGFKTPSSVEVGRVLVKVRPLSLLSDTIHVQQILVENPAITYEVGLGESNIGTILANVEKYSAEFEKKEKQPEKDKEKEKSGKKVIIDEVSVTGGQVRLSSTFLQGNALPLPLPPVTLHDLGKDRGGINFVQATNDVLASVFNSVTDVAKKGLATLNEGAKKAGEAIGEGAKKAGEAIGKGVDKLKNLF